MVYIVTLYLITPQNADDTPNRLLTLLGGVMPDGLIQALTVGLFIYGMIELKYLNRRLEAEHKAYSLKLVPETENWVISAEEANELKLQVQQAEQSGRFFLTDIVKKCCTKYRLSRNASEALDVAEAQINIYREEVESEQSYVRYVAWAMPSIGFIGTVWGISKSLGFAGETTTPEGLKRVTDALNVAFDTTLVALILSIFLMLAVHRFQKKQDAFFASLGDYIIENLINRFYK